jgi:hypothetical protein
LGGRRGAINIDNAPSLTTPLSQQENQTWKITPANRIESTFKRYKPVRAILYKLGKCVEIDIEKYLLFSIIYIKNYYSNLIYFVNNISH